MKHLRTATGAEIRRLDEVYIYPAKHFVLPQERIDRAIGRQGTVYLTVPARKAGAGKVTIKLQNRTVEYKAMTGEEELPTGAQVVVVSVVAPGTVEVVPASNPERPNHV